MRVHKGISNQIPNPNIENYQLVLLKVLTVEN